MNTIYVFPLCFYKLLTEVFMQKHELLQLLESEKRTLLKTINAGNSGNIIGLFESSGLIKKNEPTSQGTPNSSKRPDMVEMDAKNTTKNGMYDASIKEEPKNSPPVATKKEDPLKKDTKKPGSADKSPKKEPATKPVDEKKEPVQQSSKSAVDKTSGYPEIQLTEQLKDIDEKDLDGVLTKPEIDSVLNANEESKTLVFRNLLLTKKADFGNSSEYECFTTGKGGTKMVKGKVPVTYITKYYTSTSEMIRPDTQEPYLALTAKLKGSEEELKFMQLPEGQKYIVYASVLNNNSEYITVLDETQYNMLFHQARND